MTFFITSPLAAAGEDTARLFVVSPPQPRPNLPIIRGKSRRTLVSPPRLASKILA
jgi:hypothetical protein